MLGFLLYTTAFASGSFAVPRAEPLEEVPQRLRARPALLNPSPQVGRVWTLDALVQQGRYPARRCTVERFGHLGYRYCSERWVVAAPPMEPPAPWWAFWR